MGEMCDKVIKVEEERTEKTKFRGKIAKFDENCSKRRCRCGTDGW
jgi:hypothetical protein